MSKIFLKYILSFILMLQFRQFDLNITLSSGFYSSIVIKQITTSCIPYNTSYSCIITITV